jgi:hypothetical protein
VITYLKQIFSKEKYKIVAVIHMKSGKKYKVPCDVLNFKSTDGVLTSYSFEGAMYKAFRFMNMNEVEFIACESYSRFGRY